MSNYLAVATVTAALSQTLRAAVSADISGANVTVARPHSTANTTTPENPTVNLYLFQVVTNKALRNNGLPSHSSDGALRQCSQLALDLNYLLTFYGDESELIPQRLLGSVLRTLNSRPLLSRDLIRNTVASASFPYLSGSDLADAAESVKFSHMPFSLEELSKLWSVFLQTPYTLSIAFQGTVVLIDGLETPATALPVRARNLYVNPFRQPIIDTVESQGGAAVPIDTTSTILIKGKQLRGDLTRVRIGQFETTPSQVSDKQISVDLTTVAAGSLRAGVQAVQVIQPLLLGTPPVAHPGVESSAAAMTLIPRITSVSAANIQGSGSELRSADITVQLAPIVGRSQRVVLMMNEMVESDAEAYRFAAESLSADSGTLLISVSGIKAATYLVRIQVDGATSQLMTDAGSDAYFAPKVTLS